MNAPIIESSGGLRSTAWAWVQNQGASTVLLFAIAAGVWKAAPNIADRIEALITCFLVEVATARKEYAEQLTTIQQHCAEREQQLLEANRELRKSIDNLAERIK